jgi:23S rRNA (uracil1939-C5)-methyltransferase
MAKKKTFVDLELTAPANLGQALGRYQGRVVFVPGGLPGERVRVRLVEERKRWARGELVELQSASPDRVEPPCPYYGRCGGCHWQHAAYPAQLAYKQAVVAEQLRRLAHIDAPPVQPTLGSPPNAGTPPNDRSDEPLPAGPWYYRNHAQFTAVAKAADPEGELRLGFAAAGSHDVVPIERCLLLHPLLDEIYAQLDLDWPELTRLSLRAGVHTGERLSIFEAEDDEIPELEVDVPMSCVFRHSDGTDLTLIGSGVYHEVLNGRRYRVSAASFFQVNSAQAQAMLDRVRTYLDPRPHDTLLDLYSGVGVIGLSLAEQVGQVIGVEEHPAAVLDAAINADALPAATSSNVDWIQGQAEEILPQLEAEISKVVLDPPRSGCKPAVVQALLRLGPERIVYVSCDPATLARDGVLLREGGYHLVEVQPLDMFPQTFHIETVSLWQRSEERG